MDEICTEDKSTTNKTTAPPPPEITLCRVGSGSVVLDPEGGVEAQSRKLPSSRFKGVVPQPNGRWGAQIYEKHQRVWLGTFNEEQEAARAYDVAVRRFRSGDALTNFQLLQPDEAEGSFLRARSKAEIVDMLRKHTYDDELQQSKRTQNPNRTGFSDRGTIDANGGCSSGSGRSREPLFAKTVTPSDVGKLNRLVIPKQHAEKHFPLQHGGAPAKGMLLHFEDSDGKVWRFRYSYWNSSQSYVLTKGWSRFVKEKNLKAGDIVSFQSSGRPAAADRQFFIGWKTKTGPETTYPPPVQSVQMLRLFGVNILAVASGCGGKGSGSMEMEVLGLRDCKKQRIIDVL